MSVVFAAQLYSVRKDLEKDLENTLKEIKSMGYDYVQMDGMRGNDPEEFAQLLKKYELEVIGMHIKHDRFENDLDGIIKESYLFDCKTIYDKYIDDEDQNYEGYVKTKKVLIDAAYALSPLGFEIGLHCPEYDYNNEIDGRNVLDYITDPVHGVCIYAEPDTYWMSIAGKDPLEEMKRYSGRMPIVHMKDCLINLDPMDIDNNLVEAGRGDVDFKSIIDYGLKNGVKYFCIEQDHSKGNMLESMKESLEYLKSLVN